MRYFHFDLKSILLVLSNACVIALATSTLYETIYPLLVAVIVASLTCTIYGMARGQRAIVLGALGGFLGAATAGLCICALHGIGYFFYDGPAEYFEDGVVFELVVAPFIYVVVWGMLGALTGMICGALVWIIERTFVSVTKRNASAKHNKMI